MAQELKVYKISGIEFDSQFYLKSEVDKVIAELEDKLRHYPMMTALIKVIARFWLCIGCQKEMVETYKDVLNKPL